MVLQQRVSRHRGLRPTGKEANGIRIVLVLIVPVSDDETQCV